MALLGEPARRFINEQRVARLATVDEHAHPHIVPISFALGGDVLYSSIDEKPKRAEYARLRRVRNILGNPAVQVLFDYYDEDWSRLRYVQLRGRARLVVAGDEHQRAVALLRDRYAQYREMALETRAHRRGRRADGRMGAWRLAKRPAVRARAHARVARPPPPHGTSIRRTTPAGSTGTAARPHARTHRWSRFGLGRGKTARMASRKPPCTADARWTGRVPQS